MRLNEIMMTPAMMAEIQKLIIERLTNLGITTRAGASTSECLMSEICIIEAKLDALMTMLDEANVLSFAKYPDALIRACKGGQATAINVRDSMLPRKR